MTRRVFHQVHTALASDRYWQLLTERYPGHDIGRRSFAETHQLARNVYWSMPWWHRWGLARQHSPARQQDA